MFTAQIPSTLILDDKDLTTPFYELQSFDSFWEALRWKYVRARIPICWKKLVHSRYMLANLVYLVYSIGILMINFHSDVNETTNDISLSTKRILDQPVGTTPYVNRYYIGLGFLHLLSAFLYWWAWRGRSWLDIIMIPEYLNHIEAGLYLWSAFWYSKQDTLGGYYTLAVHRIELTAAIIELFASFGWYEIYKIVVK
jgi:hypothetical protein